MRRTNGSLWGAADNAQRAKKAMEGVKRLESMCKALRANLDADLWDAAMSVIHQLWDEANKIRETLHPLAYGPPTHDGAVAKEGP